MNEENLTESIELNTEKTSTKIFLILLSPIISPIWLFRKFMWKSKSIKIEIKYG